MSGVLLGEKREGDITITGTGGLPKVEETFVFRVLMNSKTATRLEAASLPGLPITNVTLSSGGYTVCKTKTARRDNANPRLWEVSCTFSSEVEEGSETQDPETNPTEWVPVWTSKRERLVENQSEDQNGDPIANSAGQPFAGGIQVPRTIPVWEFWQFEPATVSDIEISDRCETVNNATFKGFDAKTLLLSVNDSSIGFYYGQPLRLTQYSLKYNKKDWRLKAQDKGTVFLDAGKLSPYTDEEGNVISGPLDGAGEKQPEGDGPATLYFDIYEPINFSEFLR